jgi:uncharacterized protein YjdB
MKKSDIKTITGCGICLVLALTAFMLGCDKYSEFNTTEKPFVNMTSVDLYIGEYADERNQIQLTCSPSNRKYSWTSNAPEIATVDQDGLVTAHSEGFAVIVVASGNDFTEVFLRVREYVPLTGFTLDRSEFAGKMQDITFIQVLPIPEDASEVIIQWTSSNDKVAQIFSNGLLKVVGLGQSVITASAVGVTRTVTVTNNVFPFTSENIPGFSAGSNLETIGYSSQHPPYLITNLFDGNPATFWHTRYAAPAGNFPHWCIFDLKKEYSLTDFMIQRRQGFVSLNGFYFYVCPDVPVDKNDPENGYDWVLNDEYLIDPYINDEQWFEVTARPAARYLKLYFDTKHKEAPTNSPNLQLAQFRLLVDE